MNSQSSHRGPQSIACCAVAALALAIAACAGPEAVGEPADLVLTNAVAWTMDPALPRAEALAVRGEQIVYVGDAAGVAPWIGAQTEVVDVAGGMVLPGFQDAHVHVLESGIALADCDLSAAADGDAVLAAVAACAAADGGTGWLRGGGYQLTYFPGGRAQASTLDRVVAARPVFLLSSDAHSAWVNSAALARAGITARTPDPAAGRIERDPTTGEPSGTLREAAVDLVARLLPPRTAEERRAGLRRGLEVARGFGITAFQDANVDAENLAAYAELAARGELTARVSVALGVDPERGPEQVSELSALRQRYQGGLLRVGTAKLFLDGVIEAQTAALLEPYVGMGPGMEDYRGELNYEPRRFEQIVLELDRQGFQIHIHAIGDRAIRVALDALEGARQANGARDARHHLAHIQLWNPADIPRLRELGVIANFQPLWAYADAFITDLTEPFLGPERSRWLYPIKSVVDSGAEVVFGSDWDVSTMNPLPAIEVGITRQDPDDPQSPVWLPEQRVDLATMLAGYTTKAARVNFLDQQTGSITVGRAADLVVLDLDLSAIPAHEIGDAQVLLTLFAGRVVYRASGVE
jgi:predicted amidohydrolase YtcJ